MRPSQQSKGYKGSQISGQVIPSDYPNNPYSVKKLQEASRVSSKRSTFDKQDVSLPQNKVPKQAASPFSNKTPQSTERLPKGAGGSPGLPRRFSQENSPGFPKPSLMKGVTPQATYNTHKIPVQIVHANSQYSGRTNQAHASFGVTGSTIGKPVSGTGTRLEVENTEEYGGTSGQVVPTQLTQLSELKDIVNEVPGEPHEDRNQELMSTWQQNAGRPLYSDKNDLTSDTKFLELNPDIQEIRDVIDTEQLTKRDQLSSINENSDAFTGLAHRTREDKQGNAETRNEQFIVNKRTVVAMGSFSNEKKRDPSEENLNLALVIVTDTADRQPPPNRSNAATQSPKPTEMNVRTLYAEESSRRDLQSYEQNREVSIILPHKKITRKLYNDDSIRSITSVSAKPTTLRKKSGFSMRNSPKQMGDAHKGVTDIMMRTMNDKQLSLNALERYKKQRQRYMSTGTVCDKDKIASEEESIGHRTDLVQKLLGNSREAQEMKAKFNSMIRVPHESFSLPAFKKLSQELRSNLQNPHQVYKQQLSCNPKHIKKMTQIEDMVQIQPTSTEEYAKSSIRYSNLSLLGENQDSLYSVTDLHSVKTPAIEYPYEHSRLALSSTHTLPMQSIAQSKESLEGVERQSSVENAGIFITNEESFADLTSLPPKFDDQKQSTPLPELKRARKGKLQSLGLKSKTNKGSDDESGTYNMVIKDQHQDQLQLQGELGKNYVLESQSLLQSKGHKSREFECKEEDRHSMDSILSRKNFKKILSKKPFNVDENPNNISTLTKTPEMTLTAEQTQSLSNYTIRISSNQGMERSKTNAYRKSNMSNILGRESRVLKKLQKRVEEQYKLNAAQVKARAWQSASRIEKLCDDNEEKWVQSHQTIPTQMSQTLQSEQSQLKGQNQNFGQNVVTSELAGEDDTTRRESRQGALGLVLADRPPPKSHESGDEAEPSTKVPVPLNAYQNQTENSVSPWKENTSRQLTSLAQQSSITLDPDYYVNSSPRRGKSTEVIRRKKPKKVKESQKVWPVETTANHAKNFKYLNEYKQKRQLVDQAQIAKILRRDMSNYEVKEIQIAEPKAIRRKSSSPGLRLSDKEIKIMRKLLDTTDESADGEGTGRRQDHRTDQSSREHQTATYDGKLEPKLENVQTAVMPSQEEGRSPEQNSMAVTGNLDVITEGISKISSRFQLQNRSSHNLIDGENVGTNGTLGSKEHPTRQNTSELEAQQLPTINIKHQGQEVTRNERKLSKKKKAKQLTQNINTSSAQQISTDLAHLDEDGSSYPQSTKQHMHFRGNSQESVGTRHLEDLPRNSLQHLQQSNKEQSTIQHSINSSALSHQLRTDYLQRDVLAIYRKMNALSGPDLSNVRVRGTTIIDPASSDPRAQQQTTGSKEAMNNSGKSFNSQNGNKNSKEQDIEDDADHPDRPKLKGLVTSNRAYSDLKPQTDGRISTNRNGGTSDRVYTRVPITEVIIKTALPAHKQAQKGKSRKADDFGPKNNSTMKLPSAADSERPAVMAKTMNKDLISDMTPEESRDMQVTGEISRAGASRFLESVYRTDGAGQTGTPFALAQGASQHLNFKPPSMLDVLGSTQERKEYAGSKMKKAGQTVNQKRPSSPLLFEPNIVSLPQHPRKPHHGKKKAAAPKSRERVAVAAVTVKSGMMVMNPSETGMSTMKLVSNNTLTSKRSGVTGQFGHSSLDPPSLEKGGTKEEAGGAPIIQGYAEMSIDEHAEQRRETSRGDRMVRRPAPEKPLARLSQVNLGANLTADDYLPEPALGGGSGTGKGKQSPYATQHLAKFKQSPKGQGHSESPKTRQPAKLRKQQRASRESIGQKQSASHGRGDSDSVKHMSGSVHYGKGMRDEHRHGSSSPGYSNLTIRNGKLRSSLDAKDLEKTTLPKITINKLQAGGGLTFPPMDPDKVAFGADQPFQTQQASDREHQRSSERVKQIKKRKATHPYHRDSQSSAVLVPADPAFQIVSIDHARGRVGSLGALGAPPNDGQGSTGEERSNSQSQITPLKAKNQFTSEHATSVSQLSNTYGLGGLGGGEAVVMHTNLSPAAVQSILFGDQGGALVTLVVPDEEDEPTEDRPRL